MLYNSDVKEVFNLPSKGPAKDSVGVEIEMELRSPLPSDPLINDIAPKWQVKGDGSLRNNGYEFVSQPTAMKELDTLMGQWDKMMGSKLLADRINDCPRASVHVHVNVRDYTYNQLMNIIIAYTLLEGVLVAYCGKYRFGNLFALRIPEASSNFRNVMSRVKEYAPFKLNSDHRYGALNLCSVGRFGTIEFRSLGSVYDPKEIDLWVSGLRYMADHAATQYKKPPDVYARYVDLDRRSFLEEFLGPLARPLMSRVSDIDGLFEDGEEYAIRLLSAHPDNWTYENDFRDNPEFLKAIKTNYGYKKSQILQMTSQAARSVVREDRDRNPSINPAGADFTDWVPAEDPNEAPSRRGDGGTRINSQNYSINWIGELPTQAFTGSDTETTYQSLIRSHGEDSARRMVWDAGFLNPDWVAARAMRRRTARVAPGGVSFNATTTSASLRPFSSPTIDWTTLVDDMPRAVPASSMPQEFLEPVPELDDDGEEI